MAAEGDGGGHKMAVAAYYIVALHIVKILVGWLVAVAKATF